MRLANMQRMCADTCAAHAAACEAVLLQLEFTAAATLRKVACALAHQLKVLDSEADGADVVHSQMLEQCTALRSGVDTTPQWSYEVVHGMCWSHMPVASNVCIRTMGDVCGFSLQHSPDYWIDEVCSTPFVCSDDSSWCMGIIQNTVFVLDAVSGIETQCPAMPAHHIYDMFITPYDTVFVTISKTGERPQFELQEFSKTGVLLRKLPNVVRPTEVAMHAAQPDVFLAVSGPLTPESTEEVRFYAYDSGEFLNDHALESLSLVESVACTKNGAHGIVLYDVSHAETILMVISRTCDILLKLTVPNSVDWQFVRTLFGEYCAVYADNRLCVYDTCPARVTCIDDALLLEHVGVHRDLDAAIECSTLQDILRRNDTLRTCVFK